MRGIVFRDAAGQSVHTPERAKITDLDALPLPDRAAIDHQQYVDVWRRHHGAGSVNLITARGCPYNAPGARTRCMVTPTGGAAPRMSPTK